MKIHVAIAFLHGDMSIPVPVASTWNPDEIPVRLHEFEERLGSSGESLDDYRVVEVAVDEPRQGRYTNWETWAFFTYFFDVIDRSVEDACKKLKGGEVDSVEDAVAGVLQDVKDTLRHYIKGERTDEVLWGDMFVAALVENFIRRVDWDVVAERVRDAIMQYEEDA